MYIVREGAKNIQMGAVRFPAYEGGASPPRKYQEKEAKIGYFSAQCADFYQKMFATPILHVLSNLVKHDSTPPLPPQDTQGLSPSWSRSRPPNF